MPKTLYPNLTVLPKDKEFTFLTGDAVAGATTIGLASTLAFTSLSTSSGQILMIGELGQEKTEIIKTSNVSNSTGSSIGGTGATLIAGLRFDHPQDSKVYIIDWDRFEVQHATTVSGSKTTLMAYPQHINPSKLEDLFKDTSKTSGFYFVRFNETVGSTNSDWSDPIPYAGYADNTVHEIKKRALEGVNEEIDGKLISDEFLNRCLWEARREYHQSPGKRPFRRRYNNVIGTALTGSSRVELPNWVEKPHTGENIYGVRIGTQANMHYYDKKEWDFDWRGKVRTTTELPYVRNTSTSIWLTNGRDFDKSAVIYIEGQAISVSRYEYSLTGDSLYNSLRITAHPTGAYDTSAGSEAYSNVSHGLPDRFTVFSNPNNGSAYIYFNRPIDTAYVGQNVYLDAYTQIFAFNSDADELDEPDPDIYVPYLKFKIKERKSSGSLPLTDPNYQEWLLKKQNALAREYIGVDIRMTPDIPDLDYRP